MKVLVLPLAILLAPSVSADEPLRVLAYASPPFFYLDNDEPAGLEYEILNYFAEAEDRQLEIHWLDDFPAFTSKLEQGEVDIAAATLTISDKRRQRLDFSESYLPVRVMLVERAGEMSASLAALRGSPVATIEGSVYEQLLSEIPGVEVLHAGTQEEMFEWVASGKARALATDSPIAFRILQNYDSLEIGLPLTEEQHFGFAVAKGSPLGQSLSEHIKKLKSSGIYFRLLERYLGARAVEIIQTARQD